MSSEKSRLLAHEGEGNHKKPTNQETIHKFTEHSQNLHQENAANKFHLSQHSRGCSTKESKVAEHSRNSLDQQWCDISEVIDSDFLISPEDIYPNRKVELEDADIKESTKENL